MFVKYLFNTFPYLISKLIADQTPDQRGMGEGQTYCPADILIQWVIILETTFPHDRPHPILQGLQDSSEHHYDTYIYCAMM